MTINIDIAHGLDDTSLNNKLDEFCRIFGIQDQFKRDAVLALRAIIYGHADNFCER